MLFLIRKTGLNILKLMLNLSYIHTKPINAYLLFFENMHICIFKAFR